MTVLASTVDLQPLQTAWQQAWPEALALWSRFVQLHDPIWCLTLEQERKEQLSGSFAMIRLVDHSIVISLRQVHDEQLDRFAKEILAHEIGHHVYCPADLSDNARLLARIRAGLPTQERLAPMISNLYSDLLINDRLQRSAELDLAGVYLQLGSESKSRVWTLYMRIYELLWKLQRGVLAEGDLDERLNQDAQLGARLIRSYAKDWLDGAGRFAMLCLPYVMDDEEERLRRAACRWCDTRDAGLGGFPDGLAEIDDAELSGAMHPAEDAELSGIDLPPLAADSLPQGYVAGELSGRKTAKNYRQPFEYAEVLKASGVRLDARDITARYYRELAIPHLISFPAKRSPKASDPMPEGLDTWDVDSPLDQVDWFGTLAASPVIVPGVTTRERHYGDSPGSDPEKLPFDLYLGIDCSGSMGDPAHRLSYPVLAGAIVALSALKAGARVKVVLSGEPGKTISTDGFLRSQTLILRTLTSYLGTGFSFGIHRLAETFGPDQPAPKRPVHVLIVSDNDMFKMLDERGNGRLGWDVALKSLQRCGGGGTFVLQLPEHVLSGNWPQATVNYLDKMRAGGWNVSLVDSMEQLVAFARQFSRTNYERKQGRRSG